MMRSPSPDEETLNESHQDRLLASEPLNPSPFNFDAALWNTKRKPTATRCTKSWLIPLVCLILGFISGHVASSLAQNIDSTTPLPLDEDDGASFTDLSNVFPPIHTVEFQPNGTFALEESLETNAIWAKLMPLGRGFVRIDNVTGDPIPHDGNSHTKSEHEGSAGEDLSKTKVISLFHQIHCLNMLRKSLSASITNPIEFTYLIPQLRSHWIHCFDYLRQALMCAADTTLENLEKTEGGNLLASVDGWGTRHMCRNYEGVRQWAERFRAGDDEGIE